MYEECGKYERGREQQREQVREQDGGKVGGGVQCVCSCAFA